MRHAIDTSSRSVLPAAEPLPRAMPASSLRADMAAYALAMLAALLFLSPFWLQRAQVVYDIRDYAYPVRFYIAEVYRSGELPLWFPYQFLGFPLVADPGGQPFYPLTILFGLLTGYGLRALTFDLGFHYFLCIALAYRCCRDEGVSWVGSLTAGLVYGLSGFLLFHAEHLNWIVSAAWLPLLLLCLRRASRQSSPRWLVLAGAVLGVLMLGGYPAFFITCVYALPLLLAPWQGLAPLSGRSVLRVLLVAGVRSATVVVVAALVSAIQVVPISLGRELMNRGAALSLERVMEGSFYVEMLMTMLLPSMGEVMSVVSRNGYFPLYVDTSLCSNYLSLTALALAAVGLGASRRARWAGAAALVFLLLSLGPDSWVRAFTVHALPAMGLFRFPSLFLLFFNVALMLMVGWGMDAACEGASRLAQAVAAWTRRLCLGAVLGWLAICVCLVAVAALLHPQPMPQEGRRLLRALSVDLFHAGLFLAGLTAVLRARVRGRLGPRAAALALCGLVVADLGQFWHRSFFLVSAQPASRKGYAAAHAMQREARAQVFHPARRLVDNATRPLRDTPNNAIFQKELQSGGYNSYLLNSTARFLLEGDKRLLQGDWAFLSGDPSVPAEVLVAEGGYSHQPLSPEEGVPQARLGGRSARLSVSAAQPRLLVLLQTAYPGWQVTVDGEPRPVRVVNEQFLGVEVPPGNHEVLFHFTPPGWWLGFSATLLGLLLTLLALVPRLLPTRWRPWLAPPAWASPS